MQTAAQQFNDHHPEPSSHIGTLWGAKARGVTASFQIVFGVLEVMLGIMVIVLPLGYLDGVDYVGWGIWCGAFSIVSGCFGKASRRSKCAVITYMVLSIIAAVMCVLCISIQIGLAVTINLKERNDWNFGFDETYERSHFILYVTLTVSFIIQGIASIIGASFTCGALCDSQAGNDRQLMYYQCPQPTQQTFTSAPPPYTVLTTGQPPQCISNPNMQPSMSGNGKTTLSGY